MKKDDEQELQEFLKERKKWKHFFEILSRKYIWIPVVILIIYLKEAPPLHWPIVDSFLKILSRSGRFN